MAKRLVCRCGHAAMPHHDTSSYGCDVDGCPCREFTEPGMAAWNADDYTDVHPADYREREVRTGEETMELRSDPEDEGELRHRALYKKVAGRWVEVS